nr:uncharacterized protein LOC124816300 [Hydra vulgaris]
MSKLFSLFVSIVYRKENFDASNYKVSHLKSRIQAAFPQLIFHTTGRRNSSEIVSHENLSSGDFAEKTFVYDNETSQSESSQTEPLSDNSICKTALHFRNIINTTPDFFSTWPPFFSEFLFKNIENIVPPGLFNFFVWLLGTDDEPKIESYICIEETIKKKVLSLIQDCIYISSNGRKQTPKSVALSMATRQITGSKELIKILSGFGHCISYSARMRYETALAFINLKEDVVLPQGKIKQYL